MGKSIQGRKLTGYEGRLVISTITMESEFPQPIEL